MATHAMSVSAPGTRKPPVTGWTVTSPCGSSRRTRSTLTDDGSGTPTVTSTSIRPPRSRTSWNRGRLECRIASDTARQAAFVPSPPWTSTPIPNSSTHGFALTLHLRTLGCRAGHYSAERERVDWRRRRRGVRPRTPRRAGSAADVHGLDVAIAAGRVQRAVDRQDLPVRRERPDGLARHRPVALIAL